MGQTDPENGEESGFAGIDLGVRRIHLVGINAAGRIVMANLLHTDTPDQPDRWDKGAGRRGSIANAIAVAGGLSPRPAVRTNPRSGCRNP